MTTLSKLEAVARIVDPSKWRVLDSYLAEVKRKYKDDDAAYDPAAFKDKASLAIAAQAAAILALDDTASRPGWKLVPVEPGPCENDSDGHILAFLNGLHAHLSADERPTAWMQYSDDQRARIQAAYRAMLAAAPAPPEDDTASIETDGPHEIDQNRRWLARQLLDSKLSTHEVYSVVANHPCVEDEWGRKLDDTASRLADEHERALGEVIDQRDAAELALSMAFTIVTARMVTWSSAFGYPQAVQEIDEACADLRQAALAKAKGEKTDG